MELDPTTLTSSWAEEIFDLIPDMVFFIKDLQSRYVIVNQTLVERCGCSDKAQLIGHTTADLFPPPLGERYLKQDRQVCSSGAAMSSRLELHLFPNRCEGWCLTDKVPLRGPDGVVIGLAGISRDVSLPGERNPRLGDLAAVVDHIHQHFDEELRVEVLAEMAGMSVYQLNRRIRTLFGITASQLITKARVDAASHLLRSSSESITEVALACGYGDHSAFTRQFKAVVGLTPSQYRSAAWTGAPSGK